MITEAKCEVTTEHAIIDRNALVQYDHLIYNIYQYQASTRFTRERKVNDTVNALMYQLSKTLTR